MRYSLAVFLVSTALYMALPTCAPGAPRADGQLEIEVFDEKTGDALPVRMHLRNTRKRPVKINMPKAAEFGDHFYIDGKLLLPLRRGQYLFDIEATPEYLTQSGYFEIERRADDSKEIEMTRFADLAKEGWFGGDVDFARLERDVPLILRAEGLQDIETNKFATLLSNDITKFQIPEDDSKVTIAPTPFAWNLPVWLASGKLDAIQLIHRHSLREGVVDHEDDGYPRDKSLYPGYSGNGRWSATVYYHVLNCGLRITPLAGSGSGANNNPVGQNRVYVHCDDEFSAERWWEGVRDGQVFVTNGPLLRPVVQGHSPGYVFHLDGSDTLKLEIGLNLATRVTVEYLEIIKNGEVFADVRLSEWKATKGRLPPIEFERSGWFLVRAVTNNAKTYQFASSGPYYVQGRDVRISERSVQFFLDWIAAAETHIRQLPDLDQPTREAMLAAQASAREYFQGLLASANAE